MKSILYYGQNKELEDQLQNIAYASGAEEFQVADDFSTLVTMLSKKEVNMLIVDTNKDDLVKFGKPKKIVFLIDALARGVVDENILNKLVVILKPFTSKSFLEIISNNNPD